MTRRDAALRELVSYNIKRASSALRGGVERVLARHGLRRTTFSALSVIAENPRMSQSDLAETLAIERPNLTQIVDDLVREGLVERGRAEADRRAYALACTARGRERLALARDDLADHDAALTAGLTSAQRAVLIAALQEIEAEGGRIAAHDREDAGAIPAP